MWEHTAAMLPYLIIMLSTFALNQILNRQQAGKRTRVETSRFRSALLTEMQALSRLYDDNIDLLNRGSENLLSARHLALVYKGNMGRLMTLDSPLLERVVAIYAENERIELFMAASSKSATALSYRIGQDSSALAPLRSMFTAAASNMIEARAAFGDDRNRSSDDQQQEPVDDEIAALTRTLATLELHARIAEVRARTAGANARLHEDHAKMIEAQKQQLIARKAVTELQTKPGETMTALTTTTTRQVSSSP